jgi:glycosyltransferase involved in cell wall biosynthesis
MLPSQQDAKRRPSVSIVIPTYNRYRSLIRLLESIRDARIENAEVIVVDDASPDATPEIVNTSPVPIIYIRHAEEQRVGRSRNDGLLAANSELVFMIDDDNTLFHDTIPNLVDVIESDPAVGVVGPVTCFMSKPDIVMYAGSRTSRFSRRTIHLDAFEMYSKVSNVLREVDGFANSFMVRRSLALEAGLIPPYMPAGCEDGYLQFKIKRALTRKLILVGKSRVLHDVDPSEGIVRYSEWKLYYGCRGKIAFVRDLEGNLAKASFALFLPIYTGWYLLVAVLGKSGLAGVRAVLQGMLDGLLQRYPLRFVNGNAGRGPAGESGAPLA